MTKRAMRKPHIFKKGGKWYWSPAVYSPEPQLHEIRANADAISFVNVLNSRLRHVEMGQS